MSDLSALTHFPKQNKTTKGEKQTTLKPQLKKLHKRLEVCQHFDMLITFTFAHDHNQPHAAAADDDDNDDDEVTARIGVAKQQPTNLTIRPTD